MKNRISDPDIELMLEFAQGSIPAFEQILKKYKKIVINVAYRFIQDRYEAEDIAQEVLLKVYNSAEKYKPKAKFSTWIYKITANTCLNKLRSKNNFQIISLEKSASLDDTKTRSDNHYSRYTHPSIELEKEELKQMVKSAIQTLPANQRMAVILQKYEGLSYKEISKIMGCSTQAVDSLLQRAKQNLKKALTPYFNKT